MNAHANEITVANSTEIQASPAASATGDSGAASATGKNSVAISIGFEARALATDSNAICLVNRDIITGSIQHIRSSKVGENGIKSGVWYCLNDVGEFVEVKD